uniref:Probable chemoreceptor glutamine deamidase CheD n=1 Tax=Bellilinea caldifistulae TaxID=360411 RepID=A0A7C4Q4M8_9CHLR
MKEPISVNLGEVVVSSDPADVLVAYGLGSCLGITMVDRQRHICGLLHAVLPHRLNGADPYCAKYVDSGIEGLLNAMLKAGADRRNLIVRMAGGANMLTAAGLSQTFDVGTRNIESALETLQRLNLPLHAQETGGHSGRTVRVYVASGRVTVRVVGGVEKDL